MSGDFEVFVRRFVRDVPCRGFDCEAGWLNPRQWERSDGSPEVVVASILSTVADIAGWYSGVVLDWDDGRCVAGELEQAAVALLAVCDDAVRRPSDSSN